MTSVFPKFYVLDELKQKLEHRYDLGQYYIVSVQHILETTGSLFEALIETGFRPDHIYVTGKIYSTHAETKNKLRSIGIKVLEGDMNFAPGDYSFSLQADVDKMWSVFTRILPEQAKIIILDDGGYTLKSIPEIVD